jgi:uncharacterized protein YndB with AHSA1/START domain
MTHAKALTITTPSDREILMTRAFNAPRALVFEAWTRPELVRHWWGRDGLSMPVCEIDLRPGGAWRYTLRDPDGNEYRFRGVYREIAPPERLVYTECFDEPSIGSPEWLTTVTFHEDRGRTTMTSRILHASREARDGHLQSGMEPGATECLNRLEELMREIAMAREVQARLMPRSQPVLRTLDYRGRCVQANGVGGDYYDFLSLDPGTTGFVLSDVAGKGIPAALLMASLQASLRSQSALAIEDLPRLLRSVNHLFHESTEAHRFATLFFGIYDDSTCRLRYENCGHNPPLLVGQGGRVRRLKGTATVLGMAEPWECSVTEVELNPGDVLVIYSDGVSEAMNAEGSLYGEARLIDAIRAGRAMPAGQLLEAIVADVERFCGRAPQDDLTLIVARCNEPKAA